MAAVGPFEGGPGKKQLIHVQRTFDRFAVGKPGDRSMNQLPLFGGVRGVLAVAA